MSSSSSSSSSYELNWSSSSSSSLDSSSSSSSSSSSLLDNHYSRLLPFTLESHPSNPVHCIAFYGEMAFAGTGSNGMILKTTDRYIWSNYYQTQDDHVTALMVNEEYLFVGTTPSCKIYRINLNTNADNYYREFGGSARDFAIYKNNIYLAIDGSPRIYRYNSSQNQWDLFYEPYGKINRMKTIGDKLFVVMERENIIYFDGESWSLFGNGLENISSVRNISKNIFTYYDYSFIDRSTVVETQEWPSEKIFDVFPQNISVGLNTIEQDGTSVVIGSSNKARIYRVLDDKIKTIFDTQGTAVHSLLNVSVGVNLAAIDNKLYLLHAGDISSNDATTTTTATVQEPEELSQGTINITFPEGGEEFELGETINIRWTSERGINDAVKIELRSIGGESSIINSRTTNSGTYEWEMPLSIAVGVGYQIYIEWLSASESGTNSDITGTFAIVSQTTTTTTTTTIAPNPQEPSMTNNKGIPILELPNWEYITSMQKDPVKDWIIFSTSEGRILRCDEALFNAYLTGEKTVYANIVDGFGNISNTVSIDFFYALYRKISQITSDKEIIRSKYVVDSSAIMSDIVKGIFLSPVLFVKEDLGFWKELIWEETKPEGSDIVIYLRNANSVDELNLKTWDYAFCSRSPESGTITRELNNINLDGRYLQIKVEMSMKSLGNGPSVAKITVNYSTKQASYFFTNKLKMENNADAQKGLLTATMTEPQNTEIKFGISTVNSSNWDDYDVITPDMAFNMENAENVKVGIKFISYDDSHIPVVDEFALMVGADKVRVLQI